MRGVVQSYPAPWGGDFDSWVVTDKLWQRVEPLVPKRAPVPGKQYVRKSAAGRPAKPARQVFEAMVYLLGTGCQCKALPGERFGRASAIHKRFLEWEKAGFFEAVCKAGLAEYDDMQGIAWRWQSVDGAMMKALLSLNRDCPLAPPMRSRATPTASEFDRFLMDAIRIPPMKSTIFMRF